VFGWAVAFAKAVVACGFEKSSCEKHGVEKAEDRLVQQLWLLKQMLNGPHMSSIAQISPSFPLSLTRGPACQLLPHLVPGACTGRQAAVRQGWLHRPMCCSRSWLVEVGRAARLAGRGALGIGRASQWGGRTACHGLSRARRRGRGGGTCALARPRRRHPGPSAGEVATKGPRALVRPRRRDPMHW
jgi:hypothetical protein